MAQVGRNQLPPTTGLHLFLLGEPMLWAGVLAFHRLQQLGHSNPPLQPSLSLGV